MVTWETLVSQLCGHAGGEGITVAGPFPPDGEPAEGMFLLKRQHCDCSGVFFDMGRLAVRCCAACGGPVHGDYSGPAEFRSPDGRERATSP